MSTKSSKPKQQTRANVCCLLFDNEVPSDVIYAFLVTGKMITSQVRHVDPHATAKFDRLREEYRRANSVEQVEVMDKALGIYGGIRFLTQGGR